MASPIFLIQNAGGNCFVTVNGAPAPGTTLWSQPYSGAPAQQFTPAQYPGTDPGNQGGVVFVLYHPSSGLVIQAGAGSAPVTLQKFQQYNLNQLWSYPGVGSQKTAFVNLATGYFLDLKGQVCNGGTIQTYQGNGTAAQQWTLLTAATAAAVAGVTVPEIEPAEV